MGLSWREKLSLDCFTGHERLRVSKSLIWGWGLEKAAFVALLEEKSEGEYRGEATDRPFLWDEEEIASTLALPSWNRFHKIRKELQRDGIIRLTKDPWTGKVFCQLDPKQLEEAWSELITRRYKELDKKTKKEEGEGE